MLHSDPQSVVRCCSIYAVAAAAIALSLWPSRPCGAETLGQENAPVQSTGLEAKRFNESRIAAALDEKTDLDFAETPLQDAIDYLSNKHEINVKLDNQSLNDAGVSSDTALTYTISGITLESGLDLILGQLDLVAVIYDEVLFITTRAKAEEMIETRVYFVRDLVEPRAGQAEPEEADYDSLVKCLAQGEHRVVHNAAAPAAKPESIHIFRPAGALVVTQPVLAHCRIEKLLAELRQARVRAGKHND